MVIHTLLRSSSDSNLMSTFRTRWVWWHTVVYVVYVLAVQLPDMYDIYNTLSLVRGAGLIGCTKIWDPVPPLMEGCCILDPLLGFWDDVCWPDWTCPTSPQERTHASPHKLWCMTSALAEHAMDTMYMTAWEDAEVLASNPCPHQGLTHSVSTFPDEQRGWSSAHCTTD